MIYESFDVGLEVRSIFLDISNPSDKVWHDGIIYKFTKLFKGKKTMRSPQRTSLYMKKYHCWSASRFHPLSFVVFDLH